MILAKEKEQLEEAPCNEEGSSTLHPALPSLATYLAIFSLSAAVLLFELALTRICSVVLWSNLAFMVVSTALFGFGLSGVYLALRRKAFPEQRLALLPFLVSLSILIAYFVLRHVPFQMWKFREQPENYLYLAIWEVALLAPFFFAGLTIANLLNRYSRKSGSLYGVDLVGAAVGSLLLIPLIPVFGAAGMVVCASILAGCSALLLTSKEQYRMRRFAGFSLLALFLVLPFAERLFPIQPHGTKRSFNRVVANNWILDTQWSALSRVDMTKDTAPRGPLKGKEIQGIWIDGGTNNSVILKWSGEQSSLAPQNWASIGAAYSLKQGTSPRVMVIGSAGGREVLIALSYGAQHVDAVEMDPSIVHFVKQPKYADYMGRLFQQPNVSLINDEGRAYLQRQPLGSYDVIQFVNNYTPVAIASGALNLSETFLLTKEAFLDYWDHLSPNGVLSLHRGATLRIALTAVAALRERGIEHPEQYMLIANGEFRPFQAFFLKRSPWTEAEVRNVYDYLLPLHRAGHGVLLWSPFSGKVENIYEKVLTAPPEEQQRYYHRLGVNLSPSTDDQPFIEHFMKFGKSALPRALPPEFHDRNREKWGSVVPRGDFPYVVILAESALLALLFIGVPLLLWARSSYKTPGFLGIASYYASLGFSFIVIEICLMKRYVLFLGHPAYSITTVLVALLCAAGVGSLVSERLSTEKLNRNIAAAIYLLVAVLFFETLVSPHIFAACLRFEFTTRVMIATLLLFPLGFLMGMPFALGLRFIGTMTKDSLEKQKLVAWAWGINGYTTIIGSAATVFIALFAGFKVALVVAMVTYLLGLFALQVSMRKV